MFWICLVVGPFLLQPCSSREVSSEFAFAARDGKIGGWGSDNHTTFFDIALTALAFLSFGIFLLNLLLNALLFPSVTTTPLTNPDPILTMITAGTTGGAIITGGTGTGISTGRYLRRKRELFIPQVDHATSVDTLVNFVTNSIETMTQKHECLPRVFCDGNRRAKVMHGGFQYIFPAVSVGISYIGKMLGMHDDLTKHLTAIQLGASDTNCRSHFPKCSR
ncbi:unnamed protein product [Orchesella dallaii]|uniref:Uncharacterized protein n=1 Tax=Orchesella dallaii TaxID=48710 RepID=A0ABP1Q3R8_9HEXA